ncbi:unnamed protein product [Polarella glacialis]|uniref:ISXO2-like transposase domain-containing protein n=1 Tax=Polarella glacialis TaxID=89957 RepID=A0A813JFW9_POLGL|nr:unnamed protein product [Polarella glacialis]
MKIMKVNVMKKLIKKKTASRTKPMKTKQWNFPAPKRGEGRVFSKTKKAAMKMKKSSAMKKGSKKKAVKKTKFMKVLYVQHGNLTKKSRHERSSHKRTVEYFYGANDYQIVKMLIEDGILQDLKGTVCENCGKGALGSLKACKTKGFRYRCSARGCQNYMSPQSGHSIFSDGHGAHATSLQHQAVVLFHAVQNASQTICHLMTGKNHKTIGAIYETNDKCRKSDVENEEKKIVYGGKGTVWKDVEADEVDLGSQSLDHHEETEEDEKIEWEQWGGVVERGNRQTLMLTRLKPKKTKQRATGPGPMRSADWLPTAEKELKNRNVVLHTDGARAYQLNVDGMLHDHVVHMKKKLVVNGKVVKKNGLCVWIKPKYTKKFIHTLPSGKKITRMGGTQIIDRFWSHLRGFMKSRQVKVGSAKTSVRTRSAQWDYWRRGEDLWLETGKMLKRLAKK